jgi:hypothetical protein
MFYSFWFKVCLEWKQWKIVAHIKEFGKMGLTPDKKTVHFFVYRFGVDLDLPHKFNNKE